MEEALADGAPLVHESAGTNKCFLFDFPGAGADYDETVQAAGDDVVVVKRRFIQQRLLPTPMEPRGVVVAPIAAADEFTMWSTTQIPHILRVMLALTTGIPEHKLRVVAPDVGGGFGAKLNVYAEEVLALVVARKLGRPVKWTESRSENYQATTHGRDQVQDIEIAATKDGTLLGLKVQLLADMGAYLQLITPGRAGARGVHVPGHLQDEGLPLHLHRRLHDQDADRRLPRRRPPGGDVRHRADHGRAGRRARARPDGAAQAELDQARGVPVRHGRGAHLRLGQLRGRHREGRADVRHGGPARRAAAAPREQGPRCSSASASRPSPRCAAWRPRACSARCPTAPAAGRRRPIRMLPTGKVEVVSGATPHGQGHHTAWSQIVADSLGVPFDDVELIAGDTQSSPKGMDTYGSRSLVVGGVAIHKATGKVLEKAKRIAAHLLEAAEDDVEFAKGTFTVKGSPEASMTIQQVALATFAAHNLPDGMEPSLDSDYVYDPENFSYPHGTHLCAVEIDTETGFTKIRKYVCVDDVGKIVNPVIVEGQITAGSRRASRRRSTRRRSTTPRAT
jgi:carbon-monoxide dehydrogenase large subunit